MRRARVDIEAIADVRNLHAAFWRAALGKRHRRDVQEFESHLNSELASLRQQILDGSISVGDMRSFRIFDPKPRMIHAPVFRERVLHHALMAQLGPVLDRALVDDSFACRVGRGSLAAVRRAQEHSRRHPWFVKVDVRSYFATINHDILIRLLDRRVGSAQTLRLCERIIRAHKATPGCGLPIGALTSQYFANHYLGGLDRHLLEHLQVEGMVRYMDDVVWWCRDRDDAKRTRDLVVAWVPESLALELHANVAIQRSTRGVSFLGFRVFPNRLLLSSRRRGRYRRARRRWEQAYRLGVIDGAQLQRAMDAVLAVTAHADAAGWRSRDLERAPTVDA